jgi:signal transduction histidine kinase
VLAAAALVAGQALLLSLLTFGTGSSRDVVDLALQLAVAVLGVALVMGALVGVRRATALEQRRAEEVDQVLAASSRDQREQLHELRSTVAGLVSGSALLDNPDIPAETREHLWASVRRELDRMERLLSKRDQPAAEMDLDEALGHILDLQHLKGRRVEFRSNGTKVRARYDALAETVNILMDNAVTHGGSDSSVVEVVERDDETVDIRVTDFGRGIPEDRRTEIFEWGEKGSESPGEGIGLHLAQRLMSEDGGSLRLAEDQGVGSSFVISLPAARRSTENGTESRIVEDSHAWLRSG